MVCAVLIGLLGRINSQYLRVVLFGMFVCVQVLRILYETRELCVEPLYIAQSLNGQKGSGSTPVVNTHNVVCYRNGMASKIGLKVRVAKILS